MLQYRDDVPLPKLAPDEVLIEVLAAGINNADINFRIGWYSKRVRDGTEAGAVSGFVEADRKDSSWTGKAFRFPRIQGSDCCGRIVGVGDEVDSTRLGERVIVRNLLRSYVSWRPFECWTFGADCDGAFAQFAKAPARETYHVNCDWSDAELASIPCAYSTAEGMLQRANVSAGERVLITGASGGVGSAAVQLARRRDAEIVAVAAAGKAEAVRALGASRVIPRNADIRRYLGAGTIDVVIDVVGGPNLSRLFELLRRGGRYALAGAIAGPLTEIDLRTVYLNDLTLFGCTFQEDAVFESIIEYIVRGEIRPVVARTYLLREIVAAQRDFLTKNFVGKLILFPPRGQPCA